jgi:hypothetical protein
MKFQTILVSILLPAMLAGCCSENEQSVAHRTVLVYRAADNSLNEFSYDNLSDMVAGAEGNNLNGGNLLVYFDTKDDVPQLYHIAKGKNGLIEEQIVKTYSEHNSASVDTMRSVLDDVFGNPAYKAETYGLVLWSHGTAWLPSDLKNYLRAFGQDTNNGEDNWLEIGDLKEALRGYAFDFIVFDACYMASVETAYALRDNAAYILASPTEILADGMPYSQMIKYLFSKQPVSEALTQAAETFYAYYDRQSGAYRSASVSVVKTEALQSLAGVCREILAGRLEDALKVNTDNLQLLEYLKHGVHALYDFEDFIKQLASESQQSAFKERLNDVVVYKAATESVYFAALYGSLPVDAAHFCGLSVYAPQERLGDLNQWYSNLDWYKAVYQ